MNFCFVDEDGPVHFDLPARIKEVTGLEIGEHLGGGCYASVWTRKGMDKSRIIKLLVCPISLDFLKHAANVSSPHFPKSFEYLGVVGYHSGERSAKDFSTYGPEIVPVHAVSYERLERVTWDFTLEKMHSHTGSYLVGSCDPCGSISLALEQLEFVQKTFGLPKSIYRAFEILRDITAELLCDYGEALTLDLHTQNYMMRGGSTLVINDPYCDCTLN